MRLKVTLLATMILVTGIEASFAQTFGGNSITDPGPAPLISSGN
jgi:hypothetical protein